MASRKSFFSIVGNDTVSSIMRPSSILNIFVSTRAGSYSFFSRMYTCLSVNRIFSCESAYSLLTSRK